jgi:hypothetical protein
VATLFEQLKQITGEFFPVNDLVLRTLRRRLYVLFLHNLEPVEPAGDPCALLATFCDTWSLMSPHDVDNDEGLKSAAVASESVIYAEHAR